MSIQYELFKASGKKSCPPGTLRIKRCPMVLNEENEDLLVSNTFGLLKYLSPALWLVPLLELVTKGREYGATTQGKIKVNFWEKIPSPPTIYQEGMEEVDIVIRVRHLVILIECKFRSPVQMKGSGSSKRDQIIRYLDAAAFHFLSDSQSRGEIHFILLTDTEKEPEILSHYRNPQNILEHLTQARPFVNYEEVSRMLARNVGWGTWSDLLEILGQQDVKGIDSVQAMIMRDLIAYLRHKLGRPKR